MTSAAVTPTHATRTRPPGPPSRPAGGRGQEAGEGGGASEHSDTPGLAARPGGLCPDHDSKRRVAGRRRSSGSGQGAVCERRAVGSAPRPAVDAEVQGAWQPARDCWASREAPPRQGNATRQGKASEAAVHQPGSRVAGGHLGARHFSARVSWRRCGGWTGNPRNEGISLDYFINFKTFHSFHAACRAPAAVAQNIAHDLRPCSHHQQRVGTGSSLQRQDEGRARYGFGFRDGLLLCGGLLL